MEMAVTISQRLAFTKNRPAGFDWIRIVLATGIVAWHSIAVSYGSDYEDTVWTNPFFHPFLISLLGMFFALSGFLVAGSLERCRTMVSFVGLRIMRIFPALMMETLLSAFILGPLLTRYDLTSYFGSGDLWDYLYNMLGLVRFVLPGVFETNPLPNVINSQLWTVPYELESYEVLVLLTVIGIYARRWLLAGAVIAGMFTLAGDRAFITHNYHNDVLTGSQLVLCFLSGLLIYRFRQTLPWSDRHGAMAAGATLIMTSFSAGADFVALPMAYLTVYIGLLNPPRWKILFSGDYSYGLFLYGFPIQQAVASLGPWADHWYVSIGLAMPLTAVVAAGSWWLIEKPVLSRKSYLIWLENRAIIAAQNGQAWLARSSIGRRISFSEGGSTPVRNPNT
jgi:peptidoglycan/LPS O-acetylase OafA/YrhL